MANDAPELVSVVVLLVGPAVPGAEILERQSADVLTAEGAAAEIVDWDLKWTRQLIDIAASDLPTPEAAAALRNVANAAVASAPPGAITGDATAAVGAAIAAFNDPWMRFFLAYDPAPALTDVDVPVLALLGDLDVQVAADVNGPAAEAALADNPDASVVTINELNHLFQPATTGAVSKYQTSTNLSPPKRFARPSNARRWSRAYGRGADNRGRRRRRPAAVSGGRPRCQRADVHDGGLSGAGGVRAARRQPGRRRRCVV